MNRRDFLMTTAAASALAVVPPAAHAASPAEGNPLLKTWTGPFGGVPPFDEIKTADFTPAFEAAMAGARAEIASLVNAKTAPNFANTNARYEDEGRQLYRVGVLFGVYTSAMNDEAMRAVETEMSPKLAAFSDEVVQNEVLFKRLKAVYDARDSSGLNAEQKRLAWVQYRNFARQGADLNSKDKARLAEINQKLAALYTKFSQNQLADEEGQRLVLDKASDLEGMPPAFVAGCAETAAANGAPGKWAIANTRSSVEPFLTVSPRRDLREKAWRMWTSRGDHPGEHDNKPVITEMLQLRAEKAKLLGFPTFAHWAIADNMAKSPDAAMDLMLKVWKPAVAAVHADVAAMLEISKADNVAKIEPWDYRFYVEKLRKAQYDFDENELKPYLQMEKMRDAMHWVAGEMFGLTFTQVEGVPVYHKDVSVFEVKRGGQLVGLWYFDPYARAGKSSGAWMNEYRSQERFKQPVVPIVSNNCNYVRGEAGKPILLSWDDATTLFHEFGHALHGLTSNVTYPSLAGTSVSRDFVEMPSQLLERWLSTPEVLNRFALHYETGKPMPAALIEKMKRANAFNQGFKTVEFLASAIYDMQIHQATNHPIDPVTFERESMAKLGLPDSIVLRHRPPAFGHIFSGDGYAAGYYSYIWADTYTADAYEAFTEAGGPYDKKVAKRLHDDIFSVGNTVDSGDAYRKFRGRDVTVDALMRDRGFPTG